MEFQLSYFKFWKMMLWKCCTQYVSKFGKLSSGHRSGKDQFSFQSQRRAMPKNVQTTIVALILYASKVMLKILQTRCQQYVNWEIQMYKLGFKEAEDPKIRLPTFVGSKRKWRNFSSGHRAGNDQFSFQSQRRAMPKNVQATLQLHSFHILERLYSESFNLGFSSMLTENF